MKAPAAGFEWDAGNRDKCCKHGLSIAEVEHVLRRQETLIVPAVSQSNVEPRFIAIGRTQEGRFAFVVFTPKLKNEQSILRPISARYMHTKEIARYEKEISDLENRRGG